MRRGVAAALRDDRLRHQPVVDDDVGLLQRALGAERQQVLGAGTGADQRDVARRRSERGSRSSSDAERLGLGLVDPAGEDLLGDRPGEEARPEAAAVRGGGRASRPTRSRSRSARPARSPKAGASSRLDPRPDVAGKHRGDALAADGDGERRAVDDRRRVEVAKFGTIDDVDRHAGRAGERRGYRGRPPPTRSRRRPAPRRRDRPRSARRRASRRGRRSGRRRSPCRAPPA